MDSTSGDDPSVKVDEAPEPLIIITPHARNPKADADEGKGGILARLAIIAHHASNLPTISILLLGLLAHHDADIIPLEIEREKREGLLASLTSIVCSEKQKIIALYIFKHGAATQPELFYKLTFDWSMISRTIAKLVSCGIVEKVGYVGKPYRPPKKPGPPVPIYALVGVDPKAAEEAQIRYAETLKKLEPKKPETFQRERQQREAHVLKIEIQAAQVFNMLPKPLITGSQGGESVPIYEAMDDHGSIDPNDRKDVKEAVLRRIQEAEA